MDYKQILKVILDIGEQMINSGAEIGRVEDSMYRLCRSYGFIRVNCWVISSNIQATVETPDGDIFTQIRHVPGGEMNFDRLDYLNSLSRKVCRETPDAPDLRRRLDEVLARPAQPKWLHYLAGVLGGTGFAIFFNCDPADSIVAVIASLIIVAIGDALGKIETNPLVFNAIISFIVIWLFEYALRLLISISESGIFSMAKSVFKFSTSNKNFFSSIFPPFRLFNINKTHYYYTIFCLILQIY